MVVSGIGLCGPDASLTRRAATADVGGDERQDRVLPARVDHHVVCGREDVVDLGCDGGEQSVNRDRCCSCECGNSERRQETEEECADGEAGVTATRGERPDVAGKRDGDERDRDDAGDENSCWRGRPGPVYTHDSNDSGGEACSQRVKIPRNVVFSDLGRWNQGAPVNSRVDRMELEYSICVVTGAGSGIGEALAKALVSEGAAHVVVTDIDEANAARVASEIGAVSTAAVLDVADEGAVRGLVAETEAAHGRIDLFVSNAGYGLKGGLDLPIEEWTRMMDVHTWAHLYAAQAVVPGMLERGSGYVLNTASAAGLLTQMDSGPYAVSKHAAVAFAEWLSIRYGDRGLGVSVLCPQAVRTNILGTRAAGAAVASARQAGQDGVLEPDQVALDCVDAIRRERFLVLPHPEVQTYFQRKADDYDRWLAGMRRFRRRLSAG